MTEEQANQLLILMSQVVSNTDYTRVSGQYVFSSTVYGNVPFEVKDQYTTGDFSVLLVVIPFVCYVLVRDFVRAFRGRWLK